MCGQRARSKYFKRAYVEQSKAAASTSAASSSDGVRNVQVSERSRASSRSSSRTTPPIEPPAPGTTSTGRSRARHPRSVRAGIYNSVSDDAGDPRSIHADRSGSAEKIENAATGSRLQRLSLHNQILLACRAPLS